MHAAVSTHGHCSAQDVLRFGGTGGEGDDVFDFGSGGVMAFLLAEAHGFFDGELVERVHGVFDVGGFDGGLGAVDAGFDLGGTLV
jgi:hypothetical protein